jgi:hypothetical protein
VEATVKVSARVRNAEGAHEAVVRSGAVERVVSIPAKDAGRGSSVNGGELLFLALVNNVGRKDS